MARTSWKTESHRLQAELLAAKEQLQAATLQRAESANYERILASLRQANYDYGRFTTMQSYVPVFPKSHEELLRKIFAISFNPLAHRILQIPVEMLHQYATPFQTEDKREEELLTDFWFDPINNFPVFSRQIIYEYGQWGEQCYPAFVNDIDKKVRLDYIHPMLIEQTILDPDNQRVVIGVKLKSAPRQPEAQILRTIISPHGMDDGLSPETIAKRETFFITDPQTGERVERHCFLFQEAPHYDSGSKEFGLSLRGTPDLTTLYDWILSTDDILSSMVERADLLSRTLWTLQVENGNLREGDEYNLDTLRQKFGKVPEKWEIRITNEKMKYQRHDYPAGTSDMVELLKAVQLYVVSGSSYPEHWFLGGVNSNTASSTAMEFPTLKKLESRQHMINHIWHTLFTHQCAMAGIESPKFKVVSTPLKDTTAQTLADSLKVLGESLTNAQTQKWLSEREAQTIYRKLVQELGVKLAEEPTFSDEELAVRANAKLLQEKLLQQPQPSSTEEASPAVLAQPEKPSSDNSMGRAA